jgi:hypothetical protein
MTGRLAHAEHFARNAALRTRRTSEVRLAYGVRIANKLHTSAQAAQTDARLHKNLTGF